VDDFTGDSFFEEEESTTEAEPATDWEQAVEAEAAGEEPTEEQAPYGEPAEEEPMASEPVADEPMASEPVAEEPMVSEPMAEEPAASQPVAEEPVASDPMAGEQGGGAEDAETFLFGSDEPAATVPSQGGQSMVQNAVIEGVQISSEQGAEPDEKVITVYFIFRDKPTSYFYEAKHKEKKIIFEFNDTEKGVSPIPSAQEPPIEGFRIEQDKVDVNAQIRGLKPEWHDLVRVSFFMQGIPEINVKDEYSVISFSFKWSTDPDKVKEYVAGGGKRRKVLITSITGGVVAAGLGVGAALYFGRTEPPEEDSDGPLDTTDLPVHGPPVYRSAP
jgi:hypothetical protein